MSRHRIIGAGAVLLAVTIGSAAAQEPAPGKPLQLLQFARHGAKAPLHHTAAVEKLAKRAEVKRHIAKGTAAKHRKMFAAIHHRVAEPALAPAPALAVAQPIPAAPHGPIWPAVNSATPGSIVVAAPPPAPQNVKTEQVISDTSDAIVADSKVAEAAPPPPQANAPAVTADPHPAAAAPAPVKSAAAEPAVRALTVRPAADSDAKSPIGSAPWLLQVLAALGGALAAGIVAGFLILRGRGEPRDEEFFAEAPAPGE